MNISSQSDILTNKLFMLASNKYGAPYCGSSLKDDTLAQGVRFWVSGIAVGSVGIPGKGSFNNYVNKFGWVGGQ